LVRKVSKIGAIYDLRRREPVKESHPYLKKNLFWVESRGNNQAKFVDFRYRALKGPFAYSFELVQIGKKSKRKGAIYDLRRRSCKSPILLKKELILRWK
jgi:hypothetical protein